MPARTNGVPVHTSTGTTKPHPRPGRCMDSAHRRLYLISFPSRCLVPPPRRLVEYAVAVFVFCSASASSVVAAPVFYFASAPSRRVQISQRPSYTEGGGLAAMSGSDRDEEAPASLADCAIFKQEMVNDVGQLQAALQRSVDDIIEVSRRLGHGGGGRWRQQVRNAARQLCGWSLPAGPFLQNRPARTAGRTGVRELHRRGSSRRLPASPANPSMGPRAPVGAGQARRRPGSGVRLRRYSGRRRSCRRPSRTSSPARRGPGGGGATVVFRVVPRPPCAQREGSSTATLWLLPEPPVHNSPRRTGSQ